MSCGVSCIVGDEPTNQPKGFKMSRKYLAAPAAVFALGGSLALGFFVSPAVPAHADTCYTADWAPMACPPDEILLSDIHNVDMFPVCAEEDCSDQPGQVGMWLDSDTGDWYLELGESCTGQVPAVCAFPTFLVIDDTVSGGVR